MKRLLCLWLALATAASGCSVGMQHVINPSDLAAGTIPVRVARANERGVTIARTTEQDLRTATPFMIEGDRSDRPPLYPSTPLCQIPCTVLLPEAGLREHAPWYARLEDGVNLPLRGPAPLANDVFALEIDRNDTVRSAVGISTAVLLGVSAVLFIAGFVKTLTSSESEDEAPVGSGFALLVTGALGFAGTGILATIISLSLPDPSATLVREGDDTERGASRESREESSR